MTVTTEKLEASKKLARDYIDQVFNQHNPAKAADFVTADVVWHGQSTRHIREGLEQGIDLENLRQVWRAVSPMVYFDKFSRWPRRSLIIYAKYDMTFLPEFSEQVVEQFEQHNLDHKVVVLPCGHYTLGETPYKYLDGWQLANFLRTAFE